MVSKMKRALILGGSGFIGQHFTRRLIKDGYEINVIDIVDENDFRRIFFDIPKERLNLYKGSFSDSALLLEAMENVELCIHLVTTTVPLTSNKNMAFDVESNLIGTIKFLDCMKEKEVCKFLYLSSGGTVYGNGSCSPIIEDAPTYPLSSYGIVKLAIEKYINLYNELYGFEWKIARLSNPYGPGQKVSGLQGAIATFTAKALAGESINVWGDGEVIRDYIYINDVIDALCSIIDYDGKQSIFNVGSGVGTSVNNIIELLHNIFEGKLNVDYFPSEKHDVKINVLDVSRIHKLTGWKAKTSLEIGVKDYIEYLKSQASS